MDGRFLLNVLEVLKEGQYQPAAQLSAGLGIGEKTLRGRFKELDAELKGHGVQIEMKKGKGYCLHVADRDAFLRLKQKAKEQISGHLPENMEQRVKFLLSYLLDQAGYVKREMLCRLLYVSEKTISQDLKHVEFTLSQYELEIEKKPFYGMKVAGSEFARRQCIVNHFLLQKEYGACTGEYAQEKVQALGKSLLGVLDKCGMNFPEVSFHSLACYLYIMVYRMGHGFPIETEEGNQRQPESSFAAEEILITLREQGYLDTYTSKEVQYLSIYMKASRISGEHMSNGVNFVISEEIDRLVQEMLDSVNGLYQMDFQDDFNLRMYLNQHMAALDIRLRYHIPLRNPITEQVKEQYRKAFMVAQQASIPIWKKYGKHLSEDEIAYFALLFEMALDGQERVIRKKKILLVCAMGKTSSQFLAYAIKKKFGRYIEELQACSIFGLKDVEFSRFDYIFSTVTIDRKVPVPILMIHDFLDQPGSDLIQKTLDYGEMGFIHKFYKEHLFYTDIKGATKEEVLFNLCGHLGEDYPLPEHFYEAVLERENCGSTDFGNLTAIPHPYRRMAEETVVAVGILEKPILWAKNEVQLVILSLIADSSDEDTRNFYELTTKLIMDKKAVEDIISKKTYQSLMDQLLAIR